MRAIVAARLTASLAALCLCMYGNAKPTPARLQVQLGHDDSLLAVAFSPDNRTVLTGGSDGSAGLWEMSTGNQLRRFVSNAANGLHQPSGVVEFVGFSPDGRRALTAEIVRARLWDVFTGELTHTLDWSLRSDCHGELLAFVFHPDGRHFLTAHRDGMICVWDLSQGFLAHVEIVRTGVSYVAGAAFSRDAKEVTVLEPDNRGLRTYSISPHELQPKSISGCRSIDTVTFFRNNIVAGGDGGGTCLWDVANRREARIAEGHAAHIAAAAFSADGKYVLTGYLQEISAKGTVVIWDVATGRVAQSIEIAHNNGLPAEYSPNGSLIPAVFSHDGRYVLTGGPDGIATLWSIATGRERQRYLGVALGSYLVAFSTPRFAMTGSACATPPKGARVIQQDQRYAIIAGGNIARIWDLTRGFEMRRIQLDSKIISISLSPDGGQMLTGSMDGVARLWDVDSGTLVQPFNGNAGWVRAVSFSPDGKLILTGHESHPAQGQTSQTQKIGSAILWDRASGRQVQRFDGHTGAVTSIAFAPNGSQILTGSEDGSARTWSVATGEETQRFVSELERWQVYAVAYSPDGCYVITGDDMAARIWEAETGVDVMDLLEMNQQTVTSVGFTADGHALTAGDDGIVRLWDLIPGHVAKPFINSDRVSVAAIAPDGRQILTGNHDHTARLWSIETGDELLQLVSFNDRTWAAASPDGRFDTNSLEEIKGLHWVMADDPLHALPVEIFMRDYYEPRLWPRKLAGESFASLRTLNQLNRAQASVTIRSVKPK